MAASLLLRPLPLLRLRIVQLRHHFRLGDGTISHRLFCSPAADAAEIAGKPSIAQIFASNADKGPVHYWRWEDPDYRKWKNKEAEILEDIEPIITLTKDILHSDRYMDGARLTREDEKVVLDKLLAYHPQSEDKIGCGLDFIMVDRHPQFGESRCLFVVRTDGGWIDFSYQKCLRAYLQDKYPSHAERFLKEHLKRKSVR